AWHAQDSGTSKGLLDVSCATLTRCFAAGESGTIVGYDGVRWSPWPSPELDILGGVSCPNPDRCWAVDLNGDILQFDGRSWSIQTNATFLGLDVNLWGVSCSTIHFCIAVSPSGSSLRYSSVRGRNGWIVLQPNAAGFLLKRVSC